MKLDASKVAEIKVLFEKMQTTEDLVDVLNYTNKAVNGEKAIQFTLQQLTYFANPGRSKACYRRFTIKKKSGAERQIYAPNQILKSIQKSLSIVLQCVYKPSAAAYGFVWDRSIVDNARKHVDSRYVYNIDLKDYFESIDQAKVWKCLKAKPFNLVESYATELIPHKKYKNIINVVFNNGLVAQVSRVKGFNKTGDPYFLTDDNRLSENWCIKKINGVHWIIKPLIISDSGSVSKSKKYNRESLANLIAAICCTELTVERMDNTGSWISVERSVLPQGAPTSPVASNMVCQKLDFLLTGVANRFGLRYTRYADDITFSSQHNVYQSEGEFMTELYRIISEQGFHIKESKSRLQKDGHRKMVTGLLVHEKVNVQSRYVKQLRMWLYYWERYGYERAQGWFSEHYFREKGHVKDVIPSMDLVIRGKLNYLKMVKGNESKMYKDLYNRYNSLSEATFGKRTSEDKEKYLGDVLGVLLSDGLTKAMNLYKAVKQSQ